MRHRSALSRSPSRHHRSSATGGSGRTPRRSLRSPQQLVQLPLLLTALLALLVAVLAVALPDRLGAFLPPRPPAVPGARRACGLAIADHRKTLERICLQAQQVGGLPRGLFWSGVRRCP